MEKRTNISRQTVEFNPETGGIKSITGGTKKQNDALKKWLELEAGKVKMNVMDYTASYGFTKTSNMTERQIDSIDEYFRKNKTTNKKTNYEKI